MFDNLRCRDVFPAVAVWQCSASAPSRAVALRETAGEHVPLLRYLFLKHALGNDIRGGAGGEGFDIFDAGFCDASHRLLGIEGDVGRHDDARVLK